MLVASNMISNLDWMPNLIRRRGRPMRSGGTAPPSGCSTGGGGPPGASPISRVADQPRPVTAPPEDAGIVSASTSGAIMITASSTNATR